MIFGSLNLPHMTSVVAKAFKNYDFWLFEFPSRERGF